MSVPQRMKKAAEQATGVARPGPREATDLVVARKSNEFRFRDDGLVPNHPSWPLLVYRGAVTLPRDFDPAAVMEELFSANGWADSWRNGIYSYLHYHSRIHEVLGVARGSAKVRFGGKKGRTLTLRAGDVAVLPAGTGHQCISASDDFLVVGAYPRSGTYDECKTPADHARAIVTIPKVEAPPADPVYGSDGPLLAAWKD
ncbi:cupin domain-containing protein [Mesorhizobium intechi]|uniref:cupin domain-containing protein n=1 Tax=Mesorhizobium intechi TaxID=537601 RepID=UPI000CC7F535|nr:cupin domain-containing protein [Mesorhizobium intechi]TSE12822.1 cupin domain-containing protein [Mesorhizobium intechi]